MKEKQYLLRSINAKILREFNVTVSEIRPGTREAFVWDGTKFPGGCPGKRECTILRKIGQLLGISGRNIFY